MAGANFKQRNFYVSLALGVFSAATLLIRYSTGLKAIEQLSILSLFFAAGALGVRGSIIALSIGLLPLSFTCIDPMESLRISFEILGAAIIAETRPRAPQFLGALAGGLIIAAGVSSIGGLEAAGALAPSIFRDVFLAVIAGTILLNRGAWLALTRRPRLTSAQSLLAHVFGIVSCLSVLAAFWAADINQITQRASGSAPLAFIMLLALTAPAALGWRLGRAIMRDRKEVFGNLLERTQGGFSGLSSEFWRRKAKAEDRAFRAPELNGSSKAKEDTQDIGVCALDRSGTVTFLNQKFKDLFGGVINDAAGRDVGAIGLTHDAASKILELAATTLNDGPKKIEFKLNQLPNPIRFLEIESCAAESVDSIWPKQEVDTVIFKVRDITDRRTVEAHLLQGQRLASLGNFISGFAHSLNNSLTAISGYASCASRAEGQDALNENLDQIISAVAEAGDRVNKLIEFANGRPSLMKLENVEQAMERSMGLLKSAAGVNHEIEFEKTGSLNRVVCDWNLVMQALSNLILNARDAYGEKRGKIRIELGDENIDKELAGLMPGAAPGEFVRMRVKDFGDGMSADVLKHACEPLFTTRSSAGHSGLGLSIVYAIVRAHDGFITIESRPEKGTTVSIYIPAAVPEQTESLEGMQAGAETKKRMADLCGNKEKILVVEDEPRIRELIAAMLSTIGYTVTSCGNGEEALDQCANSQFDLLLVDMIMPKMGGLELLSHMRHADFGGKALIMTGSGLANKEDSSGAGVISKPFDINTLARAVKNTLADEAEVSTQSVVIN